MGNFSLSSKVVLGIYQFCFERHWHDREQTFDRVFCLFTSAVRWHSNLISIIDSFNYFSDNCFVQLSSTSYKYWTGRVSIHTSQSASVLLALATNSRWIIFSVYFLSFFCLTKVNSIFSICIDNCYYYYFGISLHLLLNSILTFVSSVWHNYDIWRLVTCILIN